MRDMIVNLSDLPSRSASFESQLSKQGIITRKPLVIEEDILFEWALKHFSIGWANEIKKSILSSPVTCWIAQKENVVVGFSCYETSAKGFFGPTGVVADQRGAGIGELLLLKALESMKELGYAYAIIGGVGPADFYAKKVNARIIEGSEKSNIYNHRIKR